MRPRGFVLAAGLAALLGLGPVACGPEDSASPSPTATPLDSGVSGVVELITCDQAPADASPCSQPYVAVLVILDDDGNVVSRVTSNADGSFKVTLPPGDYVIQPTPGDGGDPSAGPQSVTVAPDDYFDVEIDYASGVN